MSNSYAAIDQAVRKFSGLDPLVNNAGVNDKVGLEHGSPQKYVESLERNLLHYRNMAHFALPHHGVRHEASAVFEGWRRG